MTKSIEWVIDNGTAILCTTFAIFWGIILFNTAKSDSLADAYWFSVEFCVLNTAGWLAAGLCIYNLSHKK